MFELAVSRWPLAEDLAVGREPLAEELAVGRWPLAAGEPPPTAFLPAANRQQPAALFIRLATHDDVHGIAALVNEYARRGDLLPRSAQAISHGIGNWFVAEGDGVIVGCVSLLRYTSGLVEVRSLAVSDSVQGKGIGKKLMHALIAEAQNRHIPTLFALTRAVPFFLACGFTITDKDRFPEKVWHDCQKCPLVNNCDETAMVMELGREA